MRVGSLLFAVVLVSCSATAARGAAPVASGACTKAKAAAGPRTVEFDLTAAPARISLLPGKATDVYAYNGTVPGPVIEVCEGDRVVIHFRNELPEATSIHWHGLHLPVAMDGSPLYPVETGKTYDYVFTVQPGTAGTYWYHPHPHHRTAFQIGMGLYGVLIVRAPDDPLPRTLTERVLVLADNRFRDDGSIDFAEPGSPQATIDFENGREGNFLLVNGQVNPTITIRSGEVQRWRIVNASAARVYRLAIPGHKLLHVGSDGGLFEKPIETDEVLIANSERVEVLVRGTDAPGATAVLQTLPYDRYIPQTRPRDWQTPRDLLTLRYTNETPLKPIALPATLRHVPALDPEQATATRVLVLTQGFIDGKTMDMHRVDQTAALGATEVWQIENLVGMDHPFHLHGFRFQVIERNGVPVPYRSWKDTVNVPKHETARFIVVLDDFAGKWMYHCHILDHEEHGMMGILEVK